MLTLENPYSLIQSIEELKQIEDIQKSINGILGGNLNIDEVDINSISDDDFQRICETTSDGFWIDMSIQDVTDHLKKSDQVFLIKINWEIEWFWSLIHFWEYDYLYWVAISSKYQWKWINKELIKSMSSGRPVFLRTQNDYLLRSFERNNYAVLKWKEAHDNFLNNKIDIEKIFTELDGCKTCLKEGVFPWIYWWRLWGDGIDYIDDEDYKWFDASRGDSLLVLAYNKEDNEK